MHSYEDLNPEFDSKAKSYNSILTKALAISGFDWDYFVENKIKLIKKIMGDHYSGHCLEYGCGIANLSKSIMKNFPKARVDGFDVSPESIKHVDPALKKQGIFTNDSTKLAHNYDLIVVASVFHHIDPIKRNETVRFLKSLLVRNGRVIIIEHNPLNPGTQWSVQHSPLDKNAILVHAGEMQRLISDENFREVEKKYIVFFPAFLKWLVPLESYLGGLPMGAQYLVTGIK